MIIPFSEEIRNRARKAVLLGAEWLAGNQVRHSWPYWTADAGRFRSVVHISKPKPQSLNSICWNTARGAQALLSAYKLERDEFILETARLALEYVKTCQIFCPELTRHHGACREETPQCPYIASRDTVEAVQAFTNIVCCDRRTGVP